jgi:hypothetical protein
MPNPSRFASGDQPWQTESGIIVGFGVDCERKSVGPVDANHAARGVAHASRYLLGQRTIFYRVNTARRRAKGSI